MPKSTIEYWNPLHQANQNLWKPLAGLEEMVEELTLSIDVKTGEYQGKRISESNLRYRLLRRYMDKNS